MGFAKGSVNKGKSEIILNSVAICTACPEQKSKDDLVIIAYMSDKKVYFTVIKFPVKKPYLPQDILNAIGQAENVKNVTYIDGAGNKRDVFVCREAGGKIAEAVVRDTSKNCYEQGFAEITSAKLMFSINGFAEGTPKLNVPFQLQIIPTVSNEYLKNSVEYAIVNAYNACLLGELFSSEEFDMETKGGKKIKIEVKTANTEFLVDDILFVKPKLRGDGFIDYYVTEEFNLFDGNGVSKQAYKIIYSNRLGSYNLIRL